MNVTITDFDYVWTCFVTRYVHIFITTQIRYAINAKRCFIFKIFHLESYSTQSLSSWIGLISIRIRRMVNYNKRLLIFHLVSVQQYYNTHTHTSFSSR
jgi:hypothetical protein